jgi:Rrf2 family protein
MLNKNNTYITLSKKCRYALRGVFELALRSFGKPVKVHRIAQAQNIPVRFLEVIFNELKHAGILESRRGSEGGYLLLVPAEDLSVSRIIQTVQGPNFTETHDVNNENKTSGDHAFSKMWQGLNDAVSEIYEKTTIADLIKDESIFSNIYISSYVI